MIILMSHLRRPVQARRFARFMAKISVMLNGDCPAWRGRAVIGHSKASL
jgi:hypothetical protein